MGRLRPLLEMARRDQLSISETEKSHEESIDGISYLVLEIFHHRQPSHMWSDHDHDMSTPLDLNQGGLSLSWKFPRNGNG